MCSGCVSVSVSVYRSSCKTRSKRQHTSTQPNTKHQMAKIRIASFAQEECSSLFFFLSFLIIIFCFAAMKHTWREDVSWTSDKALAKSGKHDLREVKCKTNKAIMWMIFFPRNLNELDRMHLVPSPKKIACTRNKRINRFSSSRRECCECKCCTVKKLHGFTDRSQLMGNLFIWLEECLFKIQNFLWQSVFLLIWSNFDLIHDQNNEWYRKWGKIEVIRLIIEFSSRTEMVRSTFLVQNEAVNF